MQKAPGSVELKPPDKGEQPMDLAPRTAHQHVAAAASAAKPTQLQVTTIGPALRPHLDTAKSAFTVRGIAGTSAPCCVWDTVATVCLVSRLADVRDFIVTAVFTTRLRSSSVLKESTFHGFPRV